MCPLLRGDITDALRDEDRGAAWQPAAVVDQCSGLHGVQQNREIRHGVRQVMHAAVGSAILAIVPGHHVPERGVVVDRGGDGLCPPVEAPILRRAVRKGLAEVEGRDGRHRRQRGLGDAEYGLGVAVHPQ